MKEVAKSQLTLLPNCKEPGCITLLAALSIPEEVFLSGVQAQPPPRAARSGLQLGEARAATRGQGGGQEKTWPGQLEPRHFQPPTLLLQDMPMLVWVPPHPCLSARNRPHRLGEQLMQVLPTALSSRLHRMSGTGLLRVQDPRCLLPHSPLPESIWADERVHPPLTLPHREESYAAKIFFTQV